MFTLGSFWKSHTPTQIFGILFLLLCINFGKLWIELFLGDFSTNSSGHPACSIEFRLSLCRKKSASGNQRWRNWSAALSAFEDWSSPVAPSCSSCSSSMSGKNTTAGRQALGPGIHAKIKTFWKLFFSGPWRQGDQMSSWKNYPKWSTTHFCVTFTVDKSSPKILGRFVI
jgi:hypothetical protein